MATRRFWLKFAAIGSLLAAAAAPPRAAAQGESRRTYVLVHGSWHGGWCWRSVADRLRDKGHRVFTPTLTGLGERKHLLNKDVDLDLFIQDIVNVLEAEELRDVYLVGHSFAGPIVTGVTDRVPERLKRLIFLDAALVQDGQSFLDGLSPEAREGRIKAVQDLNGVKVLPVVKASAFGIVEPEQTAWVERRLVPQPFVPYTSALKLAHPIGNGLPVTYIRCVQPVYHGMDPSGAYAKAQPGWQYLEIASGHDAMVIVPERLTEMLLGVA